MDPAEVAAFPGTEPPEPQASRAGRMPIWLVVLFGVALGWGALHIDRYAGGFHPAVFNEGERFVDLEARVPKFDADGLFAQGNQVFGKYCAACHQSHGRGLEGQFPPLVESDWVVGVGPNRMIRIALDGLQGPITVKGQEYNNVMLPWRDQLSDLDIAVVLSMVRGNRDWGHSDSPVTPEMVKRIRDATQDRGTYWTAPELQAIPDKD